MSKRSYRGVLVKHVEVTSVLSRLSVGALWVGMDIGKSEVFVVVRDSTGVFERPWKVKLPFEIPELVARLKVLHEQRGVTIVMESTGTYGEALRQSLTDAGLAVRRVRSQATSDYAEIFDGVPSQHDGKDAAMLAELGAIGKSAAWPSKAITEATAELALWGRQKVTAPKIATLLSSARDTLGVRMTLAEEAYVRRCAQAAFDAGREMQQARRELTRLASGNAVLERMSESVGTCTACVLFATLGNPQDYHCGAAYRKAMGLNLKERSSGQHQGQLKITKRGPSAARRWLFFAALRHAQSGPVRSWFEAKKKKDKDRGLGAVVAIMRKLALAVHATVTRDEPFQLARLLPGKPWKTPPVAVAHAAAESAASDLTFRHRYAYQTPAGVLRHLTARLDQIFNVANSMLAVGRDIPGKSLKSPQNRRSLATSRPRCVPFPHPHPVKLLGS